MTAKKVHYVHHGMVSVGFRDDPRLVLVQAEDHSFHVDIAMTPDQAMAIAKDLMQNAERARNEKPAS
jgi:hypothetical protein